MVVPNVPNPKLIGIIGQVIVTVVMIVSKMLDLGINDKAVNTVTRLRTGFPITTTT